MLRMETKYKNRCQIGTNEMERGWDYNFYSLECDGCWHQFNIKAGPGPDGRHVLKP